MAANKTTTKRSSTAKKNRKGIHAKTKETSNKHSKNYKKPYVGQGK